MSSKKKKPAATTDDKRSRLRERASKQVKILLQAALCSSIYSGILSYLFLYSSNESFGTKYLLLFILLAFALIGSFEILIFFFTFKGGPLISLNFSGLIGCLTALCKLVCFVCAPIIVVATVEQVSMAVASLIPMLPEAWLLYLLYLWPLIHLAYIAYLYIRLALTR